MVKRRLPMQLQPDDASRRTFPLGRGGVTKFPNIYFNMDETGLFWKRMSSLSHVLVQGQRKEAWLRDTKTT